MEITKGLDFYRLQSWLCLLYFNIDLEDPEATEKLLESRKYVLPMSPNFLSPFQGDTDLEDRGNTFIQFFIDRITKVTQDYNNNGDNKVLKEADISLRFSGKEAETWCYLFQHLTKREPASILFQEICNAQILESVHDIEPIVLSYSGDSPIIGFDTGFSASFVEEFNFIDDVLGDIYIAPGEVRG